LRESGSRIEKLFIFQVSGVEETVVYLTEDSELALGKSHLSSSSLFFFTPFTSLLGFRFFRNSQSSLSVPKFKGVLNKNTKKK
jgi:hypothetical protein